MGRFIRQIVFVIVAVVGIEGCAHTIPSPTIKVLGEIDTARHVGHLPENWIIPGDSQKSAYTNLLKWALARGITFAFRPDLTAPNDPNNPLLGFTGLHTSGWAIILRSNVPINTQYYTLIHELAHVYQSKILNTPASEIFAELVALQVAKRTGLNALPQTTLYLASISDLEFEWTSALSFNWEVDVVVNMLANAAKGAI